MSTNTTRAHSPWQAPRAHAPVCATVALPGSKSMTNRALILAAGASGTSHITGALLSRDCLLMMDALRALGCTVTHDDADPTRITISPSDKNRRSTPHPPVTIDCGLAGTVMRFVPPLAATTGVPVTLTGDEQAKARPMTVMVDALTALGVTVEGTHLPLTLSTPDGFPAGGTVTIDASSSSQFVSGLLLSAAHFTQGMTVIHSGGALPSRPHILMTLTMLREAGCKVTEGPGDRWTVAHATLPGRHWIIEPDLSNATPFLAAAALTGGTVTIPHWPSHTTQAGDAIRGILTRMGCMVELNETTRTLTVTGPTRRADLHGLGTLNMSAIGELTPTVAVLAALASTPTRLTGIAHLRGHETDRLAALAKEMTALGGRCTETEDGLNILPSGNVHGGLWHAYADHRMATAGAILGLVIDGMSVDDIGCTSKTLPSFVSLWNEMLATTPTHTK